MTKKKNTENQTDNVAEETLNQEQNAEQQEQNAENADVEGDKMAENCGSEVKEWQDKYMRLSAEFDNYRKRTLKEMAELVANGGSDVLKAMLSTADDFDRALQHITDEGAKAGVELIYNKFMASLNAKGVKVMELKGQPFDVDFAEAIAKFPATSPELSGTIMDVAEKGYMMGDKVLRFAKVVVFE